MPQKPSPNAESTDKDEILAAIAVLGTELRGDIAALDTKLNGLAATVDVVANGVGRCQDLSGSARAPAPGST